MSIHLINKYYTEVEKAIQFGGSKNESSISPAFHKLLNEYASQRDLYLASQIEYKTPFGTIIRPDGTLKDVLSLEWGYWESKDTKDKLDEEIEKKFAKGYPHSNILFEDSHTVVLIQGGREIGRCLIAEAEKLDFLLKAFTSYTRPEVRDFRDALDRFKTDLPQVLATIRQMIEKQMRENPDFISAHSAFLALCRESINPIVSAEDVTEMLIQHILTEDIFTSVFDDPQFHEENNISKELQKLELTFFTGVTKRNTLDGIKPYYQVIKAQASRIASHTEKQKFLKIIYENFYKVYNPKAADRLGVAYTPNEIVNFMIEGVDYLLGEHFQKGLASPNVDILDPATGTGTFITDLIEYLPRHTLEYKYKHEIHCNELAILPYYIANLNIEATYKQKMGKYEEFKNICLMDTLDNMGFERENKQMDMFGFSAENAVRVRKQNTKKISVIIGNPPYNAKQDNYNSQNANRIYGQIDKRIKETYIAEGTSQNQIVLYDMYVRFFRWASDRLNKDGILAFVSNNSFVNSNTFDGFRKTAAKEFQEIYIIDLKGNARNSGERRRQEGGNVFSDEIRVGVAIYFMVRNEKLKGCKIYYNEIGDYLKAEAKKSYLHENKLANLTFNRAFPDAKGNWINQTENDFDSLIPLIDKEVKSGKAENAIFKNFTSGLKTQRDEWAYDFSKTNLETKMREFVRVYEETRLNPSNPEKMNIKWDRELDKYRFKGIKKDFEWNKIVTCLYRPYSKQYLYYDKHFNGMTYQWPAIFREKAQNKYIAFSAPGTSKDFHVLSSDTIIDLHFTGDSQCLPLFQFDNNGRKFENITDWGLEQFQNQYTDSRIMKEDIFHYSYAVLYNPEYRRKYEQNLKRELPRIPFYKDFNKWANWGKELMKLHIDFENAKAWPLIRMDLTPHKPGIELGGSMVMEEEVPYYGKVRASRESSAKWYENQGIPKPKLKADKEDGIIILDTVTSLEDIPPEAWQYKLGNRSALEWVLEQYKEKKISDPTIAERYDAYRFADYKEQLIDLLKKVCTVSVETMRIVKEME